MRDEVDVAIRYGALADSRLVARHARRRAARLQRRRPTTCAAIRRPQTPQDLLHHNCLTFDRGGRRHRTWRFCRDGHWTEVRVDGDRSVDDASLAREWALAGAGIILKSGLDQQRDLERGALVPLLPEWETEPYPLHALLPSGRFVPNRVRALVDFLAERFESIVSSGRVRSDRVALSPRVAVPSGF